MFIHRSILVSRTLWVNDSEFTCQSKTRILEMYAPWRGKFASPLLMTTMHRSAVSLLLMIALHDSLSIASKWASICVTTVIDDPFSPFSLFVYFPLPVLWSLLKLKHYTMKDTSLLNLWFTNQAFCKQKLNWNVNPCRTHVVCFSHWSSFSVPWFQAHQPGLYVRSKN